MHSATRLPVIILYDERHREPSTTLAEAMGMLPVSVTALASAPDLVLNEVVVNVDLSDLRNVAALRDEPRKIAKTVCAHLRSRQ